MLTDHQFVDARPAGPARSASSSTMIAPPPMTSTRPSCIGPSAARCARVIAISSVAHRQQIAESAPGQMNRLGVVDRSSAAPAPTASSWCPPRRPRCARVRRAPRCNASPSRSRTTSRAAAISCRCRRVGVQASLREPHTPDVGGEAGLTPSRTPSTTSVDPPPRSTTTKGAAAESNSPTAPRNDSSASSVPVITSATAPGTPRPAPRRSSRRTRRGSTASRVAEVATMRTVGTSCSRISSA